MKKTLLFFLLSVCFYSLTAQTYSVDQYAARYERRPLLEIRPHFSFSGIYVPNADNSTHNTYGNVNVIWREELNLDDRIQSFQLSFDGQLSNNSYSTEPEQNLFSGGVGVVSEYERYNYQSEKRFWGFNNQFDVLLSHNNYGTDEKTNNTNVYLSPGIFAGSGRIEYAEDAILANWMIEDLIKTGTIDSATPEQHELLARRITSIIGNRVFGPRKRRIYELQQLQSLFLEEGLTINDDFSLFAVLNDNWVFARRAILPHGKRWKYGLDGALGLNYFDFQQSNFNNFTARINPYLEREVAFIKNNNSSHIFSGRLGAYLQDVTHSELIFSTDEEYSYGTRLDLGYQLIWLPISRTRLIWENNFGFNLYQIKRVLDTDEESDTFYTFNSNLTYDYFIGPQWMLQLSAGVSVGEEDLFNDSVIRPYLSVSSQYFVF